VELASKVGISKTCLGDIEKGRKRVRVVLAARFAEAMGYSTPYFVQLALQEELNNSGLRLNVEVKAAWRKY
jgi:DNA-binding XRE family transcriptional regulator